MRKKISSISKSMARHTGFSGMSGQLYQRFYASRRRALIVSSRPEEQVFLKTFLTHLGFAVHVASDKNSLIDFLVTKKPYELVLVSEHFEAIGLGFFPLYFRQGMGKYRAKLIYFGPRREVVGFDDCLDFAALISRSLG